MDYGCRLATRDILAQTVFCLNIFHLKNEKLKICPSVCNVAVLRTIARKQEVGSQLLQ